VLIEYQLLIIEINFSPTKDNFLDHISAVFLTRCRGDYFDLRREIRVTVRITLRLAFYVQSFRLGAKPFESHDQYFLNSTFTVIAPCNIISDERMGLSFTITAGPRQRSHFRARVPRDS
jgi:hypothetical protein